VIFVTANRQRAALYSKSAREKQHGRSRTYEGWWDLSLIDDRNERPLQAAFVAVIVVWATALLFALV